MRKASNKQLANEYASKDRQEVADVHTHDSQHAFKVISIVLSRECAHPDLQQIPNTNNDRSERRPGQIHTQPPRPIPSRPSHRARSARVHSLRSAQLALLIPICLRRHDERSLRFRLLTPDLPH